jgi:hypothetical protein
MALKKFNIKDLREADAASQDANMRSRWYSGDAHMQTTQQSVRYVLPLSIYFRLQMGGRDAPSAAS